MEDIRLTGDEQKKLLIDTVSPYARVAIDSFIAQIIFDSKKDKNIATIGLSDKDISKLLLDMFEEIIENKLSDEKTFFDDVKIRVDNLKPKFGKFWNK